MRPISKGDSPYTTITNYGNSLNYLVERIGSYCSYCEMPLNNAPEIEHIVAKSKGGDKTDWNNLLLSCKYCNTRKGDIIGTYPASRWIWPDKHNTFLAFTYTGGRVRLNEKYLSTLQKNVLEMAKNIFTDIDLGHIPQSPKSKDNRFRARSNAYARAVDSHKMWQHTKTKNYSDSEQQIYIDNIANSASSIGFFSVWMEVFKGESKILCALIKSFCGTCIDCFDQYGNAIARPNSVL